MGYEDSVYLAKLAEQAERYEEMVENMKNVASADQELSVEERNLLSVAYKNVIGARRASWRIVTSIEQKEESKGNEQQVALIKEYRQKIEAELAKICEDILEVLDKHLIPSAQSGESKVFYHKMKGDYHRYLAEFATGDKRNTSADKSLEAYQAATEVASTELAPTHPIRLGQALDPICSEWRVEGLLPQDEGRLPPLPRRVCHGRQAHRICRQVPRGIPGCH